MFLEVTQAKYINRYRILLEFNDGVTKIVDLQYELNGKIFEPLKETHNLQKIFHKI